MDLFGRIASEATQESPLWSAALLPRERRQSVPVFSPLADEPFALGLESIYEGYLLHYGRPRLFGPADRDTAVLLGDYLYAHGLVRIAAVGDVAAVSDLAELLARCAHLRAERLAGDGPAWAATVSGLRRAGGAADPDAVERALALHRGRVD